MTAVQSALAAIGVVSGTLAYIVWVVLPRRLAANMDSSVFTFSTAIELRCETLRPVNDRIVNLCILTGKQLRLSAKEMRDLEHAARLRNIGLVTVPWQTMNGVSIPGKFPEDSEQFAKHPSVGASMLNQVPTLRHLSQIVQYQVCPNPAEAVPIQSHIIHCVTHYVQGVQQSSHAEMVEHLQRGATKGFDQAVVEALLSVLPSESVVTSSSEVVSC